MADRIGPALQSAPQLQSFLLQNVTSTGKQLGGGSYGVVEELVMDGMLCAGKKIYDALIDPENQGAQRMVEKYYSECSLLSEIRHPHIVQFLGICFLPDSKLPVLVMEKLHCSLDDLLENTPDIPLHVKLLILQDVARGLVFLHNRTPAVIHRDLTARNVLLNPAMTAKIADLGNSRIANLRPGQLAQTMTQGIPGTMVYMPPEASLKHYGPSLDIFSFGHLALFTAIQVFPCDLLPHNYTNQRKKVQARTELERREPYIQTLDSKLGKKHNLIVLLKKCLAFQPEERPTARQVLDKIGEMRSTHTDPYEHMNRLQMEQAVQANSISEEKIKSLEAHLHQMESVNAGMDEVCKGKIDQLSVKEREITVLKQQLSDNERRLITKEALLSEKESELHERCGSLQTQLDASQRKIRGLEAGMKARTEMLSVKEAQITALTTELNGKDKILQATNKDVKTSSTTAAAATGLVKQRPTNCPDEWEIDRGSITLTRQLGEGIFSKEWQGVWNNTTPVSVKVQKGDHVATNLNEATIMKQLKHHKILQLYAVCTKKQPIYIITEVMKHGSLLDFLHTVDGRSLKLPQLIDMLAQVASAMSYLEEINVVHRNLGARNVRVGEHYICKVAGFRLAKFIKDDIYEGTKEDRYLAKWTAPEAALYNQFSIKSDVWTFGILIYETVTYGRPPYPGMTNGEVLDKIEHGYHMPCPEHPCTEKLYNIMLDCWRRDSQKRPTFETLQWKLEEFFVEDSYEVVN